MRGTGLHKFWYLRLIAVFFTVIFPIGFVLLLRQYAPDTINDIVNGNPFALVWTILGWLFYTIIIVLIMLKIERYLSPKNSKEHIKINTVNMSEDQKQKFDEIFSNFNTIFQNINNFGNMSGNEKIICPNCKSQNVGKLRSGKYICLDCEYKFHLEK